MRSRRESCATHACLQIRLEAGWWAGVPQRIDEADTAELDGEVSAFGRGSRRPHDETVDDLSEDARVDVEDGKLSARSVR